MPVDSVAVRRALDKEELEPVFQPVVELHTGLLTGFEVLARWHHPRLGLVLPENFIAIAEENGLMACLLQQILRKAFLSAPSLPAPLTLAVNISPSQLLDPLLLGQIRKAAEAGGFPLGRLSIEITENGLIENLELAQKVARELKAMGCLLALDDFGTGYSSLRHLQALPFDTLKVDRSFVSSMTGRRESRKIVAAIVGLAHSLGLLTIAEGVETEEQAEMLLCLGCQMVQGWLYGRPMLADQIPRMVAAPPQPLPAGLPSRGNAASVSSLEALPALQLAQLQALYDGSPVGLCFLDRKFRYVSINPRLAEINASSTVDYLGKTVQEMIPEVFEAVGPYLLRALKGEAIRDLEFTRPARVPGKLDMTNLVSYQPVLDEAGEVIGISVAVTDITDRKRAEVALRESEEHLRFMIELNPEIPWVMDSEGNNLDVSSRWEQITGLTKERTRNLGWLEALHPDDLQPTMKALLEGLRSGKPINVEYRVKNLGTGWRWMRSRGSPRIGPAGQIVRWYGAVEDIDDRKKLEEALHKLLEP